MTSPSRTSLRLDIQAMRALAVLAVIVAHFWPTSLPGGFAGVDVFFVVSGFLITSQLVREADQLGRINLANFWVRRVRRIFPAAFTVIAATVGAVHLIGVPTQLKVVTNHAIASVFSAINFLLAWEETDYNARTNTTSPLQHFWSLAVEEQFYLVWPLLIVAMIALSVRFNRSLRDTAAISISIAIVASVAFAVVSNHLDTVSYFDPFSRVWELGLGALVAIQAPRIPAVSPRTTNRIRITLWTLLIGSFGVNGLDELTPGLGVLPSVVLAVALIAIPALPSNRPNGVREFVSTGVQWVGDRSFSLYLWHWPALILAPYFFHRQLGQLDKLAVIAIVLVLSDVTYRVIENPARYSGTPILRRPIFVAPIALALSLSLTVTVLALPTSRGEARLPAEFSTAMVDQPLPPDHPGMSARFPFVLPHCGGAADAVFDCPKIDAVTLDPYTLDINPPSTTRCPISANDKPFECVLGAVSSPRKIAFVGDSHSRTWWKSIDIVGKRANVAVSLFFRLGCAYRAHVTTKCGDHNAKVRDALIKGGFDVAIFTQAARDEPKERYVDAYTDLTQNGVPIVVIADNTHLDDQTRSCVDANFPKVNECELRREDALDSVEPAVVAARQLELAVFDFSDVYCEGNRCAVSLGGMQVHKDGGHMFASFLATMAPFLWNDLRQLGYLEPEQNN